MCKDHVHHSVFQSTSWRATSLAEKTARAGWVSLACTSQLAVRSPAMCRRKLGGRDASTFLTPWWRTWNDFSKPCRLSFDACCKRRRPSEHVHPFTIELRTWMEKTKRTQRHPWHLWDVQHEARPPHLVRSHAHFHAWSRVGTPIPACHWHADRSCSAICWCWTTR